MTIKAYDKQGKLVEGFRFSERDSVTEQGISRWKCNFLTKHPQGSFKEVKYERN